MKNEEMKKKGKNARHLMCIRQEKIIDVAL